MLASLFNKPQDIQIVDYNLRNLNSNELLVKVSACGICGTDYHIYNGKAHSFAPVILGHEYSGVVVDKGSNVTGFEIDDPVAVDPNIICGICEFCKSGKINLCKNLKALGVDLDGGFAEFSIVPSSQVYKIKKTYPLEYAAFAEPLSCCLRGIQQAQMQPGNSVVIVGGGTIGLLMVQLVKLFGASKTIVIEPNDYKRELSLGLGADLAFGSQELNLNEKIFDYTSGGADIVIECAGNAPAVNTALSIAGKGGTVVLFGLAEKNESVQLNLQEIFLKELTIKTSLLNPKTFQKAIDLLTNNKISVEKLISNRISLNELETVLRTKPNKETLKNLITIN